MALAHHGMHVLDGPHNKVLQRAQQEFATSLHNYSSLLQIKILIVNVALIDFIYATVDLK